MVGQEQVVVALKNAIAQNRVHHAYLFSGPRGVGKTSLARIFAKSLNCQDGPTIKACGKCHSCLEINRGTSLDIIEIDGASNRGIDDIRTLRENVKLSPVYSRYKIYIIDEVHQITTDGFNALLKTLEEPPSHVKFIFATTHPQKVLPTILSRCQKFSFHLISAEEIVNKLKKIAKSEKLKIEDSLLYAIARAAGGSIRDAESLLDQLAPVILEKVAVKDVFSFLGIIDDDTLNTFLKSLAGKNLSACIDFIDKTVREGRDLDVFINALLEHLRHLLLAKVSMKSFQRVSDISPQSKKFLVNLSKTLSSSQILQTIDLLIEAKDLSRKLNTIRIPLELAIVKFCCPEHKTSPSVSVPTTNLKPPPVKPTGNSSIPLVSLDDELDWDEEDLELDNPSATVVSTPEQPSPTEETTSFTDTNDSEDSSTADNHLLVELQRHWQKIISDIRKVRVAIASHLSYAQPVSSTGKVIRIGFNRKDSFHKEIVEQSKNLAFIEGIILKVIGKSVRVKFIISDNFAPLTPEAASDTTESSSDNQPQQAVTEDDDSFINDLLDTFGGKIHTEDT
jgi:DNA polymerase-3 subunit gamma/tau